MRTLLATSDAQTEQLLQFEVLDCGVYAPLVVGQRRVALVLGYAVNLLLNPRHLVREITHGGFGECRRGFRRLPRRIQLTTTTHST